MNTITQWPSRIWAHIDEKIILWGLKKIHGAAGRAIDRRLADQANQGWKEQALADFKAWLISADHDPAVTETQTAPDLYTLLAEFLSLKNQIQIQNREQARTVRSLKHFNEFSDQGYDILQQLTKTIDRLEQIQGGLEDQVQSKVVISFLDVRDALARGLAYGEGLKSATLVLTREKRNNLIQGYQMALRRFDRSMAMVDTFPIETLGRQFDPETMKAVDTCQDDQAKTGEVITEISGGFIRKGRVLRHAKVIVNKS